MQFDTNTLGRTVDQVTVEGLPLVTRNFTQIVGLSAGVVQPVNNASALGRGTGSLSFTGGFNVNGARNYDNNFQLDGLDANDLFASGANSAEFPFLTPMSLSSSRCKPASMMLHSGGMPAQTSMLSLRAEVISSMARFRVL